MDGPNDIVLEEVEETFEKNGRFGVLCRLYEKAIMNEMERKGGNSKLMAGVYEEKLLEAYILHHLSFPVHKHSPFSTSPRILPA